MVHYLISIFSRFCLLFSLISSLQGFLTTSSLQDERLVMRIIHHNSILSPYYNKSSTVSDRANFAVRSSMARLAYFKAKIGGAFLQGIQGSLVPNPYGTAFLLNVSIGHPPVPQLVLIDTGSYLSWVQCQPCISCKKTVSPIFNPRRSSSYVPLTCHASECGVYDRDCDADGYCAYTVKYFDESNSTGVIAYEQFTFSTSKGSSILQPVVFGCGTKNNLNLAAGSGVLGLGANKLSIVSSLGSQFSYCIGNIGDPYYISNFLILGRGAFVEGYSTPFQLRNSFYYVSLEGITVGQTKLAINSEEFKFNILIDSGTSLTFLARSAYEPLKAEVQKIINGSLEVVKLKGSPNRLCYNGNLERSARGFPTVTFHLAEETDIDLDIEGLFYKVHEGTFCMAIEATDGPNTIGIIAQQYYNVGFDLNAQKVSFERIDCNVFENTFSSMP